MKYMTQETLYRMTEREKLFYLCGCTVIEYRTDTGQYYQRAEDIRDYLRKNDPQFYEKYRVLF